MKRGYFLPLIALLGLIVAVIAIVHDNRPTTAQAPAIQAPVSPWPASIAGAGIIETALGNAALSAPVPGVVTKIYVKVGDRVKAGDPLFKIDDRDLQAKRVTLTAKIKAAQAALQIPKHRLEYAEQLVRRDPEVVSKQELTRLSDEVRNAVASLELARAELRRLDMDLERRTVRAPAAGEVLKIGIREGEFTDGRTAGKAALLFGQDDKLYVRTDIDESDEWRFQPDAGAIAFVRGNRSLEMPLHFEYIEPYVTPKTALTGQSTERTDRRVFQVIYSFDPGDLPVHVGQQVDVFIQAPPVTQQPGGGDG